MSTDHIRYDLLVQDALKSVVRKVLGDAVRDGLPGEHHFYISFRTEHAGVRLSTRLRERYPQEMTIVLQHQYDNLTVNEAAFEVGLSFSGVAERLRVPFDSLSGFFDPSVQFGLKFEAEPAPAEAAADESASPPELATVSPIKGNVPKIGTRTSEDEAGPATPRKRAPKKEQAAETPGETGAEVVSLDSFRKKS